MKSLFKYSAIAAAMLLVQQASAVDIVITGSTAFRGPTHDAIANILTGETVVHSHASSLGSANQSTFKGTASGITGDVYVFCSWSGSATGVIAVANSTPVSVISASVVDARALSNPGTTLSNTLPDATMVAKMAFSDVFKESTSAASAALTDSTPAVIPFRFMKSDGGATPSAAWNALTNVTAQNMRRLWNSNRVSLGLFTGDLSHTSKVFAVGRDNGSGTRITVLAETKYGINEPVQQWKVTTSGGVVTQAQLWPEADGVGSDSPGNGGYDSGSKVFPILGSTAAAAFPLLDEAGDTINGVSTTDRIFMAWLGLKDANDAKGQGAEYLSYEGVPYSLAAVQNGQYTLWGYLHLYYPTLTTDENNFRLAINTQFANSAVLGTNGVVKDATMRAARTFDGGVISINY